VLKDAYWMTDAEHYSIPIRLKKGTGNGVRGGLTGRAGACWLFDPGDPAISASSAQIPVQDDVYSHTTPIAGVLDPKSKAIDPQGQYFYFARQSVWRTRAGSVSRYITNGGGGWGKPKMRAAARVLSDVRNGYVSIEQARLQYGVEIAGDPENDPEGLKINEELTKRLRA
jgi:N-methylhydantoinase B